MTMCAEWREEEPDKPNQSGDDVRRMARGGTGQAKLVRSRCGALPWAGMTSRHRTLALLRHAKSAYPAGVVDQDRPLAPRGVREAGLAGNWLRANLPAIDLVLCSTATRARQTLARAGVDAAVRYVERLYGGSPSTLIDEINTVADDVTTLLVVGHEPAISALALDLAGAGTNREAAEQVSKKFPTSGIAVLHVAGRWQQVEPGMAALVNFHVPR